MTDDRQSASDNGTPSEIEELRRQAEERLSQLRTSGPVPRDADDIVHELRVHQIELEMQNEELRRTQVELQVSHEKYFELFDLAPIAYVTLGDDGVVSDANFTAAQVLGVARRRLVGRAFSTLVHPLDTDAHFLHRRKLEQSDEPRVLELRLLRAEGAAEDDAQDASSQASDYIWARLDERPKRSADGQMTSSWVTFTDITERRRAEQALRESEGKFRSVVERASDGIAIVQHGRFVFGNPAIAAITGYALEEFVGTDVLAIVPAEDRDRPPAFLSRPAAGEDLPRTYEMNLLHSNGSRLNVDVSAAVVMYGDAPADLLLLRNVTQRKLAESYRAMSREVLQRLNEPGDLRDSIQRTLDVLKMRTGFDAVGIRLQVGDDFPYFVQEGFATDFLLKENTLTERAVDGGVCWDEDGNITLECTCGLVISGKTDPAEPFFTQGGSFWTNDSVPLLNLAPEEDPRYHQRNECIHRGYCSIALVPIRIDHKIVGLIQFNDTSKDRFTLESVELLEGIAAHVGAALLRKQTEEDLLESDRWLNESQRIARLGHYIYDIVKDRWDASATLDYLLGVDEDYAHDLAGFSELVHTADRERFSRHYTDEVLGQRAPFDLEYRIVRPRDGAERWVRGMGTLRFHEDGHPIALFGVIQDVTERKG